MKIKSTTRTQELQFPGNGISATRSQLFWMMSYRSAEARKSSLTPPNAYTLFSNLISPCEARLCNILALLTLSFVTTLNENQIFYRYPPVTKTISGDRYVNFSPPPQSKNYGVRFRLIF